MFWSEFRELLKETDVRCYFLEGVAEPDDDAWVTVTTEYEDGFWERMEEDYAKGQTITVHLLRDETWVAIGDIPLDRDAVRRWNDWHINKVRRVQVSEGGENAMAVDWVGDTPELERWRLAAQANLHLPFYMNPAGAIRATSLGLTDKDKRVHLDGGSWEALFSEDVRSVWERFRKICDGEEDSSPDEAGTDG